MTVLPLGGLTAMAVWPGLLVLEERDWVGVGIVRLIYLADRVGAGDLASGRDDRVRVVDDGIGVRGVDPTILTAGRESGRGRDCDILVVTVRRVTVRRLIVGGRLNRISGRGTCQDNYSKNKV